MRDKIIKEAKSWLGTSFHHQGRLKKTQYHTGGCDCIGLVVGVAKNLKINIAPHDRTDYPTEPNNYILHTKLTTLLSQIKINHVLPGDILLFAFDKYPQHLAIMSYNHNIIHSHKRANGVVEHPLTPWWYKRIYSAYTLQLTKN